MTFAWSDYSKIAAWLVAQGGSSPSEEAAQRSAISRAYYAVFRTARDWVERKGLAILDRSGQDHETVIHAMRTHTSPVAQGLGVNLDRLRRLRSRADYESTFLNVASEAQAAVVTSQRLLGLLSRL